VAVVEIFEVPVETELYHLLGISPDATEGITQPQEVNQRAKIVFS
jgi:hypothetical protein